MHTVVAFDFATKHEQTIPLAAAAAACAEGRYCWIDIDTTNDAEEAAELLRALGLTPEAVATAFDGAKGDHYDIHEDCLHLKVSAGRFDGGHFVAVPVDLVLGERVLLTVHRGEIEFINQVRRTYRQDFLRFAQGPGFLLYECWDHLIDSYRSADRVFSEQVRTIQEEIFGDVDDEIFTRVAEITRDLLAFRQVLLASREVLNELCIRRSSFVPVTTQPYLEKMVVSLNRLDSDLSIEREILSETLHLYMGIVSHRTNKILTRLTVVSLVFLPLSFLCGIYGMNFRAIPELEWRHGYVYFWTVALLLVAAMLTYMKRHKLW